MMHWDLGCRNGRQIWSLRPPGFGLRLLEEGDGDPDIVGQTPV
jgi:hypothetical protein